MAGAGVHNLKAGLSSESLRTVAFSLMELFFRPV